MKLSVGIVGWRGMVGSVLMNRMLHEKDFDHFNPVFFSSSMDGKLTPAELFSQPIYNSNDILKLKQCDVILTTQGSSFTEEILPKLQSENWKGYWIDAASNLRMNTDSTLLLDPINNIEIKNAISSDKKIFVGANCTVSLMLMAIGALFKAGHVEWVSSMTYQAISGAGAAAMTELLSQFKYLSSDLDLSEAALTLEKNIKTKLFESSFPKDYTVEPLAASLLPWIDVKMDSGQSKEEWKAMAEANKILNSTNQIPIDGTCVRVSSMRSHCQGLTIKLKKDIPVNEISELLKNDHQWVKYIQNEKEDTLKYLTPASISGTLDIGVGRVRKMNIGNEYLNVFTVGDQLLWGAAEPLRRFLRNFIIDS